MEALIASYGDSSSDSDSESPASPPSPPLELNNPQEYTHALPVVQITLSSVSPSSFTSLSRIVGPTATNPFQKILTALEKPDGGEFDKYYSLLALNDPIIENLSFSIKILLKSTIRNCDEFQVDVARSENECATALV
ncbi:hypothetical protein C1H46_012138 [Malus baccata]|uniref:Uncharacterized protein n=1 Tax=Malus baccata TaxID=106549 RepID=A0A540MTY7_MALBA|nr:hypothetical protein C1H46_012138 [Malus baccata]